MSNTDSYKVQKSLVTFSAPIVIFLKSLTFLLWYDINHLVIWPTIKMKKITRKNHEKFLSEHASDVLVLDVGAGKETTHSYEYFFPNRHTIDIEPERKPDTVGDIHDMPFDNESYEMVLCTEVLEHCIEPQKAIDELYRVLKKDGKCILTTRFMFPLHDVPNDYFRYTKYGLRHLFKDWSDVIIVPETETFSALGAIFQRLGFQTQLKGGKVSKIPIYFLAWLFDHLNILISKEFGNIQKTEMEQQIMTTGYYVVAYKR